MLRVTVRVTVRVRSCVCEIVPMCASVPMCEGVCVWLRTRV